MLSGSVRGTYQQTGKRFSHTIFGNVETTVYQKNVFVSLASVDASNGSYNLTNDSIQKSAMNIGYSMIDFFNMQQRTPHEPMIYGRLTLEHCASRV
jgi:hypothetical protein